MQKSILCDNKINENNLIDDDIIKIHYFREIIVENFFEKTQTNACRNDGSNIVFINDENHVINENVVLNNNCFIKNKKYFVEIDNVYQKITFI